MKFSDRQKWSVLAILAVALTIGFLVAERSLTFAFIPPGPDCGPTFQWICVVPGCPSCPDVLFEGTVCEKAQFERKTGRVCSAI